MTSIEPTPSLLSERQDAHTPHGSGVGPCSQLSERARMRALDVLPQPRGPENRYAWCNRPLRSACDSGSVTCSCPMTSAKVRGRYLRYSASATPAPSWTNAPLSVGGVTRTNFVPPGWHDPLREPSGNEGPPVHPSEPAYPCCLPALGRFTGCTPHEGLTKSLPGPGEGRRAPPRQDAAPNYVSCPTEDSPRGLGRTLGKRVGIKPSRV